MRDRHGGFGRYGLELLRALQALPAGELPGVDLWVLFRSDRRPRPAAALDPAGLLRQPLISPARHRWQRRLLVPALLRASRIALFHALHPGSLPLPGGPSVVATAHDIVPAVLPEPGRGRALRALDWLEQGLRHRRPRHLVAISEATRRDLCRIYRIPASRISVVPHGVNPATFALAPRDEAEGELRMLETRHGLSGRWFLSVGSDHYRKNQPLLVEAWIRVAGRVDAGLVVVGRPLYGGVLPRLERDVRAAGLDGRFHWLRDATDAEIPALYRNATAVVAPSRYEGFGMTILEAMSCGAPVLASRGGAHEEVGADAALYFDPDGRQELEHLLVRIGEDAGLRREMRARGLARAASFTWSASALAIAEVYRRILAPDPRAQRGSSSTADISIS